MNTLRKLTRRVEDALVCRILTKRNVALVDPECGCLRSPDVPLSQPCPDPQHLCSTQRAYRALDAIHA
jgi:hypothetical protein